MSILPLAGHHDVRARITSAIRADRFPQVMLITGPRGVGKQRLALWIGQHLLCTHSSSQPCGECPGCRQALSLSHPDLHWMVPLPRPKPGDPDKQQDELAGMLEIVMAERRDTGIWQHPDGMSSHGIASARLLQRRASMRPVAGGWRVFVIGHAERLIPQESSPEAANALLKLLEEPPAKSVFLLTTTEPGQLLPTIRSRATPLRLGRLSESDVRQFLIGHRPDAAERAAPANGAIGSALSADADGAAAKASAGAREFLEAVGDGPVAASVRALRQPPWQARGDFTALLEAVADGLAKETRSALSTPPSVTARNPVATLGGVNLVIEAVERAAGNVNPQLLLAVLGDDLAEAGAL